LDTAPRRESRAHVVAQRRESDLAEARKQERLRVIKGLAELGVDGRLDEAARRLRAVADREQRG
jgi:hypothetical protein